MGKLRGKFLIGKIRDLIFKEVRGVQLVTSKVEPGIMKQTVATKIAAGIFALASKVFSSISIDQSLCFISLSVLALVV